MKIEDLYIDFMSLNNLKRLAVNSYVFQEFKNLSLLEYAKIYDNINIECLKKILSIKSLKEIDIESIELENDINLNYKISNIIGDNKNISKLYIRYEVNEECIISDKLVNKFPNLTDLTLFTYITDYNTLSKNMRFSCSLEIMENPNCKINKITLKLTGGNIKLYCQSFESLEKIEIQADYVCVERGCGSISNISEALPMFSNKKVIYKSLIELNLYLANYIELEEFKNLINNIEYMPNLKKFIFIFKGLDYKIDNVIYEDLIRKLLSLKLEYIRMGRWFLRKYYLFTELKKINKNSNFFNSDIIMIEKLEEIKEN